MSLKAKVEKLEKAANERAEWEFDAYMESLSKEQLDAASALLEADLEGTPQPDFEAMSDAELEAFARAGCPVQRLAFWRSLIAEAEGTLE